MLGGGAFDDCDLSLVASSVRRMTDLPDFTRPAIFTLDDDTEIACAWFAERRGHGNVHALLYRQPPGPWRCTLRTRMYRDARAFDSADSRAVYTLTPNDPDMPLDTMIATFDQAVRELAMLIGFTDVYDRVDVHAVGAMAYADAIKGKSWAQTGPATPLESPT